MKNIQYFPKIIASFLFRYKFIIFIALFFGAAFYFISIYLLSRRSPTTHQNIGISGSYRPENIPDYILDNLSDSLVTFDENLVPVPNLAVSWNSGDSGKSWVFELKNDAKFSNGQALTAEDINYNFSDVNFSIIDKYTISYQLETPYSPFPSMLDRPILKEDFTGTGPWSLEKLELQGGYIKSINIKNLTNKNSITYKFFPNRQSLFTSFKLGKIDQMINVTDVSEFENWNTIKIDKNVNQLQIVTLFFNNQSGMLSDKKYRQALSYAINKDLFENRVYSPISSKSWAYNPKAKRYEYDQAKSKELLKDIPESKPLTIVVPDLLLKTAEGIQKDWQQVGVESEIIVSSIFPSEYDVYLTIYDLPKDPDQYPLWHSTQETTNVSKYSNDRIDKLLEDGRSIIDIQERKRIYLDFQRFLMEDVPALFLYHPTYYTITRK